MILKGTFTCVWNDGFEITTPAELLKCKIN